MSKITPRELGTDEVLTQLGTRTELGTPLRPPFQQRPRRCDTDGISVILGELTVRDVVRLVRTIKAVRPEDGVRYTTVGKLQATGFLVVHTPTNRISAHVSVSVSVSLSPEWGEDVVDMFDSCWGEPMYVDGGGDTG